MSNDPLPFSTLPAFNSPDEALPGQKPSSSTGESGSGKKESGPASKTNNKPTGDTDTEQAVKFKKILIGCGIVFGCTMGLWTFMGKSERSVQTNFKKPGAVKSEDKPGNHQPKDFDPSKSAKNSPPEGSGNGGASDPPPEFPKTASNPSNSLENEQQFMAFNGSEAEISAAQKLEQELQTSAVVYRQQKPQPPANFQAFDKKTRKSNRIPVGERISGVLVENVIGIPGAMVEVVNTKENSTSLPLNSRLIGKVARVMQNQIGIEFFLVILPNESRFPIYASAWVDGTTPSNLRPFLEQMARQAIFMTPSGPRRFLANSPLLNRSQTSPSAQSTMAKKNKVINLTFGDVNTKSDPLQEYSAGLSGTTGEDIGNPGNSPAQVNPGGYYRQQSPSR